MGSITIWRTSILPTIFVAVGLDAFLRMRTHLKAAMDMNTTVCVEAAVPVHQDFEASHCTPTTG